MSVQQGQQLGRWQRCVAIGGFGWGLLLTGAAWADAPAKVTFEDHVKPIFRNHCLSCHNTDKKRADLDLSTYQGIIQGSSGGTVVAGGDSGGSKLFLVMDHQQEPVMPPGGAKIPADQLSLVKLWIDQGLLETAGSKAVKSNKPKLDLALSAPAVGRPDGPPPMPGKEVSLEPVVFTEKTTALTAIAASPWAPLVALAGQQQIVLYNTDTLELVGVLPFPEGVAHVLKFSRNGKLLLAGGGHAALSGKVVVWNIETGTRIIEVGDEFDVVLAADISSDQARVALGGPGKLVKIFDTATGELLHSIKKHTDWVTTLEFSPDSVLLASGDRSGGLHVWEAFSGQLFYTLDGHKAMLTGISWRSDSNIFASASEDSSVKLWEMQNGGQVKSWNAHGGGTQSITFTHDGRLTSAGRDRYVKVWNGDGAEQKKFEPFNDIALLAVFSHDGKRVIGGDWTGEVRVWNVDDGKLVGNLATNPPTLTHRLEVAQKQVQEAGQQAKQFQQAFVTVQMQQEQLTKEQEAAKAAYEQALAAKQQYEKAKVDADARRQQAEAGIKAQQELLVVRDRQSQHLSQALQKANEAAQLAAQAWKDAKDSHEADRLLAEAANKTKAEVDWLNGQKQQIATTMKDLEMKLAQANQDIQNADKQIFEANKRAEESQKIMLAKTEALKPIQEALNKAKAEADQAHAKLAAAKSQVQHWQTAQVKSELARTEKLLELTATEQDNFNKQADDMLAVVGEIQKQADQLQQQLNEMPQLLAQQDQAIEKAKQEMSQLQQQLQQGKSTVNQRQQLLQSTTQLGEQLQQSLQSAESKDQLQPALDKLRAVLPHLEQEVKAVTMRVQEWEKQLTEKQHNIQAALVKREEMKKGAELIPPQLAKLMAEKQQKQAEADKLRQMASSKEEQVASVIEKLDQLSDQLQQLQPTG